MARFIIFLADSGAARVARSAASLLGDGMPGPTQNRFLSPLDRMPGRVRQILKWFWTEPAFYRALADQIAGVPAGARLVAAGRSYGDLPLVVVSAENPDPEWEPRQRQMAELSTRGHHVSASESSHWIPVDRPDLVVEVIRAVVETARNDLEDGPGDPADLSRSFSTATKEHGSCHRHIRAEETR